MIIYDDDQAVRVWDAATGAQTFVQDTLDAAGAVAIADKLVAENTQPPMSLDHWQLDRAGGRSECIRSAYQFR